MNTSIKARLAVTALAVGILVPAAPAAAKIYTPPDPGTQAEAPSASAPIPVPRLPRDPSQATPFVAEAGSEALRRDPSQATQFVAEVAPEATVPGDGFEWGAAAIGAGAALFVVALIAAGSTALGGRRRYPSAGGVSGAASQGA